MEPRSGSRITCCAGAEGSCEGLLFRSRGSLAFAAELVLDAEDRLRDFGGVRAVSSTVVRALRHHNVRLSPSYDLFGISRV